MTKGKEPKEPTGDYRVGFCKPPLHSRFPKGGPGGPGRRGTRAGQGSPQQGANSYVEMILAAGSKKISVSRQGKVEEIDRISGLYEKLQEQGLKGNVKAIDIALKIHRQAALDKEASSRDDGGPLQRETLLDALVSRS